MRLVQRYSLEPFMIPRQFFYPLVVIEFYNTMTSRREPDPTAIHFSIDSRPGMLWATDIEATFNLPVVLSQLGRLIGSGPIPRLGRWFVYYLKDTTVGSILLRRLLPPSMLLIDHILRYNIFLLQHIVQRR